MKVNILGGFGTSYGYGAATENLAIALQEVGVDVYPMKLPSQRSIATRADITPKGKKLLEKPTLMTDTAIFIGHPPAFREMSTFKHRIGYSMFESDKLPTKDPNNPKIKDWAEEVNKHCTRLWTPSESSKQLFLKHGVKVPIDIVRNGVDPELFPFMERPKDRDIFTFLSYGVLTIRKNPGKLICAFNALFKNNPKAHLILKTQSGTLGHLQMEDNITIIDKVYPHEQLIELIKSADVFVFPSRGEGFGLPPIEAMSTGLPTIVSANSGMLEYANGDYNFPIPCLKKIKTTHVPKEMGDIGYWDEPDYGMLKATMKFLYDNRDYGREIGLKGSKWIQENFSWQNAAMHAKSILENLTKE
jgi:glycosyltransferase involved in cell wall biosynthesis